MQLGEFATQDAVSAAAQENVVVSRFQVEQPLRRVSARCFPKLAKCVSKFNDVSIAGVANEQARREPLHGRAQFVNLMGLLRGDIGHRGPAVGNQGDEFLCFQLAEGFAQ